MAGQERKADRVRQTARATLVLLGQEIRRARLDLDLSQRAASAAIGKSASAWSRLERGEAPRLALSDFAQAASVVGLELSVRLFPGGQPLRDSAHLGLLERFRSMLGDGVRWQTEVPFPNAGDRRAWDGFVRVAQVRVGIEAETRARDSQALQRRLALKRRDGGADHLILLLANTRHNRSFLRAAGEGFLSGFPVPGPLALERLEAGRDPRGSAIVLL